MLVLTRRAKNVGAKLQTDAVLIFDLPGGERMEIILEQNAPNSRLMKLMILAPDSVKVTRAELLPDYQVPKGFKQ